jgi:hypothetical protein
MFFNDLYDNQKRDRLDAGKALAQQEGISLGLALLNILAGKYDLKTAQKRQKMKEKERQGQSFDFFTHMIRRPGNFK